MPEEDAEDEVVEETFTETLKRELRPPLSPGDMILDTGPALDRDFLFFTADDVQTARALAPVEQRALAAELVVAGCTLKEVGRLLNVSEPSISRWFRTYNDEIREVAKECMTAWGLREVGKNLRKLGQLRDNADKDETARKAVHDIQRIAGIPIDSTSASGVGGNVFNFKGGNNQVNIKAGSVEMEDRILEIAGLLGPEASKLVEKETGRSASLAPIGTAVAGKPESQGTLDGRAQEGTGSGTPQPPRGV